jgi:hypothetical protein
MRPPSGKAVVSHKLVNAARSCEVDRFGANAYLARMANRLFLTLLALMTGLAAQIGPAQARACASASAEIGAVMQVAQPEQGIAAIEEFGAPEPRVAMASDARAADASDIAPVVPAVRTGIDRARE